VELEFTLIFSAGQEHEAHLFNSLDFFPLELEVIVSFGFASLLVCAVIFSSEGLTFWFWATDTLYPQAT